MKRKKFLKIWGPFFYCRKWSSGRIFKIVGSWKGDRRNNDGFWGSWVANAICSTYLRIDFTFLACWPLRSKRTFTLESIQQPGALPVFEARVRATVVLCCDVRRLQLSEVLRGVASTLEFEVKLSLWLTVLSNDIPKRRLMPAFVWNNSKCNYYHHHPHHFHLLICYPPLLPSRI